MPVSISFTMEGMWSWLHANPDAIARAKLVSCVRLAQRDAFREWASQGRGQPVGLELRFSERGFSLLGMTPRAASYQTRQIKFFGKVLPYASPDNNTGQMRSLVLGGGYAISNLAGDEAVTTQFSVTGANILNRLGGNKSVYRQEFLGFDRGGKADAAWLKTRSNELAWERIKKEVQSGQKNKEINAAIASGDYIPRNYA